MNLNLTGHKCPTCQSGIRLNLYRNREEIIECKNCKSLLVETPKSRLISSAVLVIGIFIAIGVSLLVDNLLIGFVSLLVSISLSQMLIKLSLAKAELKIRDKITNRVTYIQKSDWEDILNNSRNGTINYEILERLEK
ncbi:hypothetical protein [uncultured Draconibacterium sp.]|uniref:hypothetical protein n=1 Tax=uncultured Draconibacterium sp. TaxID=1573823 RepID=UPI0029C63D62|nr:hypothetical protein [uncultured Draconibacterium sp.]